MTIRLCRGCKKERGPDSIRYNHYCDECLRQMFVDRNRHLCGKEQEGYWHVKSCNACREIHAKAIKSNPYTKVSGARRAALPVPIKAMQYWSGRAHAIVCSAIDAGDLPKLDGANPCFDCGKPAQHYDHRDYGKPLDVDPVCRTCNKLRGSAKYPAFREPFEKVA